MSTVTITCPKAEALGTLAEDNGWDATIAYSDISECVDVVLSSFHKHPDTGEGWEWGAVLRYYRTGENRWRLGALDDAGKRVVGGVAKKVPSGPEFEFWLGSVKMLEGFIIDPDETVAWFEKVAPAPRITQCSICGCDVSDTVGDGVWRDTKATPFCPPPHDTRHKVAPR